MNPKINRLSIQIGGGLGYTIDGLSSSQTLENQIPYDIFVEHRFDNIFISVLGSYSKTKLQKDLVRIDKTFEKGDVIRITRAYFFGGYIFDMPKFSLKPSIGYVTNRFGNPNEENYQIIGYGAGLDIDKNIKEIDRGKFFMFLKSRLFYANLSEYYNDFGSFGFHVAVGCGFHFNMKNYPGNK